MPEDTISHSITPRAEISGGPHIGDIAPVAPGLLLFGGRNTIFAPGGAAGFEPRPPVSCLVGGRTTTRLSIDRYVCALCACNGCVAKRSRRTATQRARFHY